MSETVRESKLVQYLSEAYAKEQELVTALEAHIGMTTRKAYKKRLRDHLKETKSHARQLERRIKQISGSGPQLADKLVGQVGGKAKSLAKGPLHMVRGVGEAEKMLKNAKTEYWNEHEEIATYTAIEQLAESLRDADTAKLARAIRREEERMANFLAKQIPVLTKAVVTEEVPASERRANGAATSRSRRRSSSGARSARASSRSRSTSRSSSGSRSSGSRAKSARSGSSRSSGSRSSGSRSSGSRSSRSRSRRARS